MPSTSSLFVTPTLAPPAPLSIAPPNVPLTLTSMQYQTFRDGFNAGLVFLQTTTDTAALGKNLPIVGTQLKDPNSFFATVKAKALLAFTDLNDDAAYTDQSIRDKLQTALVSVLPGPIDILSLNGSSGSRLQFNFNFQEALTTRSPNLDFDLALVGLGFDLNSPVVAKTSYGVQLGFGLDFDSIGGDRFYIDTLQDKISIGLDATANLASTTTGQLGTRSFTAQGTTNPRVTGNIAINGG